MNSGPVIVWFRNDLRLADNPALVHAAQTGRRLICVYLHDEGSRPLGGAARWFLHGALASLQRDLNGALHIVRGEAPAAIPALAQAAGASEVVWNRRYDAGGIAADTAVKAALKQHGIAAKSFNASLLHEPWTIATATGAPFRVFTPFWRACRARGEPAPPLPKPRFVTIPPEPGTLTLATLGLLPRKPDWAAGLRASWQPGEAGAHAALATFLTGGINGYAANRDRPGLPATSRLSPHLRFGTISPAQIWHAVTGDGTDHGKFRAELGWREFSYHLLYHWPDLATRNFAPGFETMKWRNDPAALRAWQRGQTGYPLVDAGMRELWQTGWMHNRVRMVAASFLIKHLLLDWRLGEEWFWDTLVDADPASNAASWQWVAGTGADAAPYFRVFNPVLQGEKFDPEGAYVRRYVSELAALPSTVIHQPWTAAPMLLTAAGVRLGETYPHPIVTHETARERALAAYKAARES